VEQEERRAVMRGRRRAALEWSHFAAQSTLTRVRGVYEIFTRFPEGMSRAQPQNYRR